MEGWKIKNLGRPREAMRAEDVGSCYGYPDLDIPTKYGRYRPRAAGVPQFVDLHSGLINLIKKRQSHIRLI